MKRFTNTLAVITLFFGIISINAHAGLITENLNEGYQVNQNGFNVYNPDSNPTMTSRSTIQQGESADISWLIDTSGLAFIDFNMKLLGNYGLASLSLGDFLLWSNNTKTETLTAVTFDFANFDFEVFDSKLQSLSFGIQASNFDSESVRVGRDDKVSFQLSNIRLSRVEVPEPSTIAIFLIALAFITRKQLTK